MASVKPFVNFVEGLTYPFWLHDEFFELECLCYDYLNGGWIFTDSIIIVRIDVHGDYYAPFV